MIQIVEYFDILKSKWKSIVVITLSFMLLFSVYSIFFIKQQYEANVKVFVGKQQFQNVEQVYSNEEVLLYQRLITTYSEIVKSKKLINNAITESKINLSKDKNAMPEVTVEAALKNLSVQPIDETQILQINYISNNAQEGYDMLYSITENLIAYSKELYPTVNIKVLEQVSVEHGNLMSKKLMFTAIGLALGLAIGIGVILLIAYMDNTFKNKKQLEQELGISVLGVIPEFIN